MSSHVPTAASSEVFEAVKRVVEARGVRQQKRQDRSGDTGSAQRVPVTLRTIFWTGSINQSPAAQCAPPAGHAMSE